MQTIGIAFFFLSLDNRIIFIRNKNAIPIIICQIMEYNTIITVLADFFHFQQDEENYIPFYYVRLYVPFI